MTDLSGGMCRIVSEGSIDIGGQGQDLERQLDYYWLVVVVEVGRIIR